MDKKKTAGMISLIFQPTFIPIILYLLVSFQVASGWKAFLYAFIGIGFVTVAPIVLITLLTRLNKVSDPDLPDRRERFIPYMLIVGFYVIVFFLFFFLHAPRQILAITMSYILVTLVGAIISLFWKISMHLAGIAGPITALVFYVHPYFVFTYLLLFLLGWARFTLKKHTLLQIFAGSVFSILLTFLTIRLYS